MEDSGRGALCASGSGRGPRARQDEEVTSLLEEVRAAGLAAGLDAVGVARAEPFLDARRHLTERKAAGLHGGMHFTYGNPERATDPTALLPGARSLVVGAHSYRAAAPTPPGRPAGRVARDSW